MIGLAVIDCVVVSVFSSVINAVLVAAEVVVTGAAAITAGVCVAVGGASAATTVAPGAVAVKVGTSCRTSAATVGAGSGSLPKSRPQPLHATAASSKIEGRRRPRNKSTLMSNSIDKKDGRTTRIDSC
jgi:hypothetical protein